MNAKKGKEFVPRVRKKNAQKISWNLQITNEEA
jgi:hypothetical protein